MVYCRVPQSYTRSPCRRSPLFGSREIWPVAFSLYTRSLKLVEPAVTLISSGKPQSLKKYKAPMPSREDTLPRGSGQRVNPRQGERARRIISRNSAASGFGQGKMSANPRRQSLRESKGPRVALLSRRVLSTSTQA